MTERHLSAETVSDLVEGLLSPDEIAGAEEHLAGCPECGDLRDALVDVRALLGDLPDTPMPADVAARLDTVLSDAGADRARTRPASDASAADTAAGVGASVPADPGSPRAVDEEPADLDAARARRASAARRMRWVGVAAASLVLVVGGAVLVGQDGGGSGQTGASAGRSSSERDRAEPGRPETAVGGRVPVTVSGRRYDARSLPAAVDQLLGAQDARGSAGDRPALTRGAAPPAEVTAPPPLIDGCLRRVAAEGQSPLAADVGTFSGRPAVVIVLTVSSRPDKLDVVVVDPSCSAAHADVRYRTRVPRP